MRKHGSPRALLPALAGAGVSIYTMLVDYHLATALVGFCVAGHGNLRGLPLAALGIGDRG